MVEPMVGPLGIWRFPILNILLTILERLRATQGQTQKTAQQQKIKNIEEWEWVDLEGNKRYIKVHRYVEPVED
jgi:hypothetical protein